MRVKVAAVGVTGVLTLTGCSGLFADNAPTPLAGDSIVVFRSTGGPTQHIMDLRDVDTLGLQFLCEGEGILSVEVNGETDTFDCEPAETVQNGGIVLNGIPFSVSVSFDEWGEQSEWSLALTDMSTFVSGSG